MASRLEQIKINGVSIPVIYEVDKLPRGFMDLQFLGGATYDKKPALSSLSARLLNEGTKKDGALKFATALEEKAISIHASATSSYINISLGFLSEYGDFSFSMLARLLGDINYSQSALNMIKLKQINSLKIKQNDYDYLASVGLMRLLFGKSALAIPLQGSIKDVEAISLGDIKAKLASTLTLSNLTILVGGDMSRAKIFDRLKKTLAILPKGEAKERLHFSVVKRESKKEVYKDTKQAYIYFGAPFHMSDIKKELALSKVMFFILGSSGFGSRLMEDIRVREGLAYSIYMRANISPSVVYARGYMQTALVNKDKALSRIKKDIADFIKNGATKAELDAAKKFILGSEPLRTETIEHRLSSALSYYDMDLGIEYQKTLLQRIKTLTLSELNAYIKEHKELNDLSFYIITKKGAK